MISERICFGTVPYPSQRVKVSLMNESTSWQGVRRRGQKRVKASARVRLKVRVRLWVLMRGEGEGNDVTRVRLKVKLLMRGDGEGDDDDVLTVRCR